MDELSVFISVDMEGVAGVAAPADVWELGVDYQQACELLTGEVNAAIRGVVDAGATNVLVNDGHMYMRNISARGLDTHAQLIRGSRKIGFMMEGIDSTKFDIALFIGYHAMAGTQNGVLCHTFSDHWAGLFINGTKIGEITYNAIYAACYECPVGLVTGDDSLSDEIISSIPWAEYVTVKKGIGRFAAQSLAPTIAQDKIYQGAKKAVQNFRNGLLKVYPVVFPIEGELELYYPDRADRAIYVPGVQRVNALRVKFICNNIIDLQKTLMTLMVMSSS